MRIEDLDAITRMNIDARVYDPYRNVHKIIPNYVNALGIVGQTSWVVNTKVMRTAFDLMNEKYKMPKSWIDLENQKKELQNPYKFKPALGLMQNYQSPMGKTMTEFQRMNNWNKVMGITAVEAIRQQRRLDKIMTAGLLPTDLMTAFRTSIKNIDNPFVLADGVQNHFQTMDTLIRKSILPLSGKQTKEVYEEVIEFIEENDYLADVLPDEDKTLWNILSTQELKNRCYQVVMGIFFILMGTTLTTEEIRTIIEQLLKVIETFTSVIDAVTILAPASERPAKQNRQLNTENQAQPQVVNQYHNTYNIIIKSEKEADKLLNKIRESQD